MSSVRWCGTADVANPRPREVGGACRRQVLAGARTQETVGGPNGAQRSEFRRTAPPDNNDIVLSQCFPAMSYVSVVGRACMALTMLQGHLTWQRRLFTWWFCHTNMPQMHLHDHVAFPARGISQSSGRGEFHHKHLRSYVLTCFHQAGRRHGPLCNTLIIKRVYFKRGLPKIFWPLIHTEFHNSLLIKLLQKLMWRRPDSRPNSGDAYQST